MAGAWRAMGPQAKEIYVIQHIEEIVGAVISSVAKIDVREVNVLDPGDGSGLASYAAAYPNAVASILTALRQTTGVDVPLILSGNAPPSGDAPPPSSTPSGLNFGRTVR